MVHGLITVKQPKLVLSWGRFRTSASTLEQEEQCHQKKPKGGYQHQFGCGILKMVGPKKQEFWPKIKILKGNHCILRIRGAPVCQKLGINYGYKVVQKLKSEKNVFFTKNGLLN